jgi:tetratricopeptide (TPR) repeat protein
MVRQEDVWLMPALPLGALSTWSEGYATMATLYLHNPNFTSKTIEYLDRAIINPKLATAHSNLGTAYQQRGDLDAAIASYTRALELQSNYPIALSNRAYSYFLKGNHERSMDESLRAIKLDSRLPMAHVNIAHARAATGDTGGAARHYHQALDLSPDHAVAEEALKRLEKLGGRADAGDEDEDR